MQMGELPTLAITTIAAIFQALIIGSVYFQMPKDTSGFFSRGGVIFFAILYNSFTGDSFIRLQIWLGSGGRKPGAERAARGRRLGTDGR